jgi:hypothetical protein
MKTKGKREGLTLCVKSASVPSRRARPEPPKLDAWVRHT